MNSNLLRLRFKGHELAYNPNGFKLIKSKNIAEHSSPISGSIIQELGFNAATVTGSGEFYGEDAKAQYDELYSLFKEGGSGVLHVLGQKPFYAYFTSIGTSQQVSVGVISYTFKFIEDCKPKNSSLKWGGRL